jgi:hypothetical protein
MKTLKELRNRDFQIQEVASSIKYFKANNIDYEVND